MRTLLTALLVIGLSFSSLQAEDSKEGVYLGLGLSSTSLDDDGYDNTLDDKDNGVKLYGGYRFNDYFALELEFADLGSYSYTNSLYSSDLDLTAFTVSAVGIYPVLDKQLDLFIMLGLGSINLDDGYFINDNGGVARFGVGLAYTPKSLQELSFRFGLEAYSFTVETLGGRDYDMTVSSAYIGAQYNF